MNDAKSLWGTATTQGVKESEDWWTELPQKCLSYCYPTSPNADKYNRGKGCYLIEYGNEVKVFDEKSTEGLRDFFEGLKMPVAPWSFELERVKS